MFLPKHKLQNKFGLYKHKFFGSHWDAVLLVSFTKKMVNRFEDDDAQYFFTFRGHLSKNFSCEPALVFKTKYSGAYFLSLLDGFRPAQLTRTHLTERLKTWMKKPLPVVDHLVLNASVCYATDGFK